VAGVQTPAPAEADEPAAIEVLRGYLAAQSTAFLAQLPRLRQGDPEAAHRIRVAGRRARSMLRTFRPLLDEEWADELSAQLTQFTAVIGPERDVEVVRRHLLAGFDTLGDQDAGVARARNLVDRLLQREATVARESTLAILSGPGFHALADQIALAPAALPGRPAAREPAGPALYPLVRDSFAAIERRVRRLPESDLLESDGCGVGGAGAARTEPDEFEADAVAPPGVRVGEAKVVAARSGEAGGVAARTGSGSGAVAAGHVGTPGARAAGSGAAAARTPGPRGRGRGGGSARPGESAQQPPQVPQEDQIEDEIWHQLRISAKRGRYAAEVCVPLAGPAATALAGQLTRLTEALGRQQDAAMACAVLARAAQTPRIVAPTAFALGRLLGAQRAQIARARWAFPTVWAEVSEPEYRRWLGS
jgi:CHAD domain-containing protein